MFVTYFLKFFNMKCLMPLAISHIIETDIKQVLGTAQNLMLGDIDLFNVLGLDVYVMQYIICDFIYVISIKFYAVFF